jgi:glycosyltransferase involved in cell wall biosynthesis
VTNRTVNVLQLISSLEVGGSEKLLLELLSARQFGDGVQYVVVVMNRSTNPEMRDWMDRLGIPVYYFNRSQGHLHPKYLIDLLDIMQRHQIHIVHAHNYGSKMWAILCKLLTPGTKMVFTIHDAFMMPRLGMLDILCHRHVIDCHIAISKTVASLCEQRNVFNYQQIYNGIPLGQFENPNRISLQGRIRQKPLHKEALQILHVGRMDSKTKGQDILIEAVHHCRKMGLNVEARLMGGVYEYSCTSFMDLQRQVNHYGLQDHIQFLANRTDVSEMLARSDLFVLPSRSEGLGLVVLEAMAAGVPVIASRIDGPSELIADGETGWLFDKGSAADLSEKIRNVCRNPAEADRVSQNALRFVKQFDIEIMKQQYHQLYEYLTLSRENREKMILQGWRQAGSGRLGHEPSV